MSKVLMVASEALPFAKTGGLADVIGALPAALRARGEDVAVVLPRYRGVSLEGTRRVFNDLRVLLGPNSFTVNVYLATAKGVPYYLADCPPLFDRDGIYGDAEGDFPDNHIRYAVLAHAALAIARHVFRPQVFHCHDWQAGFIPVYLKYLLWGDPTFLGAKVLFTIHNLGFKGLLEPESLGETGLDEAVLGSGGMELDGQASLLQGALSFSDALSTVSRRYAEEIQTPEYGFGLEDLLGARKDVLAGILNGVDYGEWNPETDPLIAAHYSAENLEGKRASKADLLDEFGLPRQALEKPLLGIVSRFAGQKGFDLIAAISDQLLAEDLYLVALGTGEAQYEELFLDLAAAHPDRVGTRIAYDNRLAHKIEAGADMFLMPSRYEPCGLNQFYSLRYGTVPVVRATGGLDDSVDEETGFKFQEYSGEALLAAIRTALAAYRDRPKWKARMKAGMGRDFSWDASAAEYSALYRRLAG